MTPEQREREIVSRMAAAHYDAYNDGEQPWDEMGPTSFKAEYAYEFYAVYSKVVAPLLAEAERAGAEQALRDAAHMIRESGAVLIPEWLIARADQIAQDAP